jgi:hypothetical protein
MVLRILGLVAAIGAGGCTPSEEPGSVAPPQQALRDQGTVEDASADRSTTDMRPGGDARDALVDATVDAALDARPADARPPIFDCSEPAQLDAPCLPHDDCCAEGLTCADFGGGGRCLPACDARQDECGAHALCVPLALPGGDQPTPGVCLSSARCTVEAEATCGPQSTCTVLNGITLCTRAGDAQTGEACTVFNEEPILCAASNTCLLGMCRAGCGAEQPCPRTARCVDYSARLAGDAFAFCHAGCDVFAQTGCAEGTTCAVGDVAPSIGDPRRQVLGTCVERPAGAGAQNQRCQGVPGTDWGNCRGGHLCRRVQADEPPICLGVCDDVNRSLCTAGSLCMPEGLGLPMGVCLGDCVIWPGPDDKRCAEGQVCDFAHVGLDQAGERVPGGFCRPGAQLHDVGEPCIVDVATGGHSCRQGHICTALEAGAPPECVALCDQRPDGTHGCPEDQGCVDAFGNGSIGVCLEGFGK